METENTLRQNATILPRGAAAQFEHRFHAVNRVANLEIDKAIREVLSDVDQWRGKAPVTDDVAILACEMT